MSATDARRATHGSSQHVCELRRNLDMLSGLVEEFRDDLASHGLFIAGQIQRQLSLAAPEYNLCVNATPPAVFRLNNIVSND
jgi:hypothetical protein